MFELIAFKITTNLANLDESHDSFKITVDLS